MNSLASQENVNAQYQLVEKVVVQGDLSGLSAQERLEYYRQVCESVGLNPLTKPFDYLRLNGKLVLYAKRDATDQLRKIHRISVKIVSREKTDDLYIVTAQATDKDNRTDESVGAVSVKGLFGEMAANAIMKAETKAKRRVTLSICGLGYLDESEIGSIPDAHTVQVDFETGEIVEGASAFNEAQKTESLTSISTAKTLEELKVRWSAAVNAAQRAKDREAILRLTDAKEKRKAELETHA